jgi:hypothetical protein
MSVHSYGDPKRRGITCHRFIREACHRASPDAKIAWRACPGSGIIAQMPELLSLAMMYHGCMYA